MSTRRETIHAGKGVRLDKVQLMNGGVAVDTSYTLHVPDSPEVKIFGSAAEASAAYLAALGARS